MYYRFNKRKIILASLFILFFFVGGTFGYFICKNNEKPQPIFIRAASKDYKFIDPILLLQVPEDDSVPEFQDLKKTVSNYINSTINQNKAKDVSVYFRELNTNRWIGVNADDTYAPGSILKVASLIAFYRASQDNPDLLSKNITLDLQSVNGDSNQDYYPPVHRTQIGGTYSTQDLLAYAIIDSDNTAAGAINALIGTETLNKTYADLRVPISTPKLEDYMSVKMYSRLFRALYNGTYISQQFSEQALDLLTRTTFTNGLVAGVTPGIHIAHKFGERTIDTINPNLPKDNQFVSQVHELHDCGIVYLPNNPYFICVMTKGGEFPNLQKIISDISGIVWNKVGNIKK